MAHEVTIGGIHKIIVNDAPNINYITNILDVAAGEAVPATQDLDIATINATVFPPTIPLV